MSAALGYATTQPVAEDVRLAIVRECQQIADSRDWWCESILFYDDPERPGHLVGASKLFLPGYGTPAHYVEVDPLEDMFMACRDAAFILDTLSRWAQEHSLEWEVEFEDPIGTVGAGGPDDGVDDVLQMLAAESGFDLADRAAGETRAGEISRKYASRNE